MAKIYLYLGRRDRKGLRLIGVFEGPQTAPVRLADVRLLNLSAAAQADVERIVHENRMYWEPWLESAENYESLKKAVRERGYTAVPINANPLLDPGPTNLPLPASPPRQSMVRRITPGV